jgi:hypothetical protein
MGKSQKNPNGGQITKNEVNELKAQVETLTKALTMMVERPVRKAQISVPASATPALPLTKNEVTTKLTALTADPKLSKSDRERINAYYNRNISVEQIKDLLTK